MGKNRVIESLGKLIGNTVVHKILVSKTSKPESINHLEAEEIEYRSQALKRSKLFNWNNQDIQLLKEETIKNIDNKFQNKYSDVKVSKEEIDKLINEEISQVLEPK